MQCNAMQREENVAHCCRCLFESSHQNFLPSVWKRTVFFFFFFSPSSRLFSRSTEMSADEMFLNAPRHLLVHAVLFKHRFPAFENFLIERRATSNSHSPFVADGNQRFDTFLRPARMLIEQGQLFLDVSNSRRFVFAVQIDVLVQIEVPKSLPFIFIDQFF